MIYDQVIMIAARKSRREQLYTPAALAAAGIGQLVDPELYDRARRSLARFSVNHAFPRDGDGLLKLPNQAPCPAWTIERWCDAADVPLPDHLRKGGSEDGF